VTWVGSWPYPQTLDKAAKTCQGQKLGLIKTFVYYRSKKFIILGTGACTLQHYGVVIYGYRIKLVCLSKLVYFGILGEARAAGLKSLAYHQQSVKYKSITIKTLWPAHTVTSSKDRWIEA
jgi:hypothetical protein